jgi:hypothetical protein
MTNESFGLYHHENPAKMISKIMSKKRFLFRLFPSLSPYILMPYRAKVGLGYIFPNLSKLARWVFTSRETTNFTYDLTAYNKQCLAALLSGITDTPSETVESYFSELENDAMLAAHIEAGLSRSEDRFLSDKKICYGRRIGWYALARIMKPRVVVETGVDKGLGSCVLCSAILKNAAEGSPGEYFGTDINPAAGYLLGSPYSTVGKILYGDSIRSLKGLDRRIDLFINDSDHSSSYEADEYRVIQNKLSNGAVIIGDNSHWSPSLLSHAKECDMKFQLFIETPLNHWYPGGGIGIASK